MKAPSGFHRSNLHWFAFRDHNGFDLRCNHLLHHGRFRTDDIFDKVHGPHQRHNHGNHHRDCQRHKLSAEFVNKPNLYSPESGHGSDVLACFQFFLFSHLRRSIRYYPGRENLLHHQRIDSHDRLRSVFLTDRHQCDNHRQSHCCRYGDLRQQRFHGDLYIHTQSRRHRL